jgi:hypothetical protein
MNYYLIVPAGDLQSMDFSELLGTPETQRLSLDGSQAIVERETYLEGWLTHEEALAIIEGEEWNSPES